MSNLRDAVLVAPAHGEDGYDQAKKTLEERRKLQRETARLRTEAETKEREREAQVRSERWP